MSIIECYFGNEITIDRQMTFTAEKCEAVTDTERRNLMGRVH